jgi:hypothetical protein
MSNPELDGKLMNQQPEKLTFEFNVNEINIIMAGLQELPHKISDVVIRNIMEQAQKQLPQQ